MPTTQGILPGQSSHRCIIPISLVIFDCDGVLVDSEHLSADVLIELAEHEGVHIDRTVVRDRFLGRSFPTVAQIIRDSYAVTLPADFETHYREQLLSRFEEELAVTPGLMPMLAQMTADACIATSSSPTRATRSLRIAGLAIIFEGKVFTASEVARGKPAPDLFLHVAERMNRDPSDCLVIEDSEPGIAAAKAAGMAALHYVGASHMRGVRFDRTDEVGSFSDWIELPVLYPDLFRAK